MSKRTRMKRVVLLLVAVIIAVVAYDCYRTAKGDADAMMFRAWVYRSNYARVAPGMSKTEVLSILHKPQKRVRNDNFDMWFYSVDHHGLLREPTSSDAQAYRLFIGFDPDGRVAEITDISDGAFGHTAKELSTGLSKDAVRKIMGDPNHTTANHAVAELWKYRLWNGVTFIILFDTNGKVRRVLYASALRISE